MRFSWAPLAARNGICCLRPQRPERGLLSIRSDLDLFCNLRPAMSYPQLADASSLKPDLVAGLNLLIVRELTGRIYFGEPRGVEITADGVRRGFNTDVYDEAEIGRIARLAFQFAQKRNGRLCSVDKANVLEVTMLWRDVVTEVSSGIPGNRVEPHLCRQCRYATGT